MKQQIPLYLGIDGGGTKCKARLEDAQGNLLGEGLAGPANPVRGLALSQQAVLDSTLMALEQAKLGQGQLPSVNACLGLAGVNVALYANQYKNWRHPFAKLHVMSDLQAACLGAHGNQDGAVIICGTGFNAGAYINGQLTEVGGHGFELGDHASGARLGINAVRRVLEAIDGLCQHSSMTKAITSYTKCSNASALFETYHKATPSQFAALAPIVIQYAKQGDVHAVEIMRTCAAYIDLVVERLQKLCPPRFSMIGGIAEPMFQWLNKASQDALVDPLHSPEEGAILFARNNEH
ncbi:BadF/BadG/BcrA/BcrD ATPase family protein [Aliiglaciecola sp. M165]|uniref:BadF/BadG/BcrA/BcrD ATPase family protein n=1 Tax=Aliiglaciecola sp. M165 TaxID=2593649 RepID=UPI00117DDD7F|nr:BadF/BadG/BcrA/BcrD ATPase family protein [Aliiglaciecola sp. M165]TRY29831.1 ATPase [Aliiglaciecola sp. M165]